MSVHYLAASAISKGHRTGTTACGKKVYHDHTGLTSAAAFCDARTNRRVWIAAVPGLADCLRCEKAVERTRLKERAQAMMGRKQTRKRK